MKSFACGDVVPGCQAKWVCPTEQELMANVGRHAADSHGLTSLPDELVAAVRQHVVTV
ncbi:MAG: DUF1059 domain-containing protein [Acidimicrobiales bacterium]